MPADLDFQSDLVNLYRKAIACGITIDEVRDKIERHVTRLQAAHQKEKKAVAKRKSQQIKKMPKLLRWGAIILPLFFIGIGFYLVGSAVMPILGYYIAPPDRLSQTDLTTPIPREEVLDITPLVITHSSVDSEVDEKKPATTVIDETLDYTNLSNWFGSANNSPELSWTKETESSDEYILDIPSLNIKNAKVKIGGSNLNQSLIAYPGTALPGEHGAPVIFGHSVLRQFYNPSPKNPRRYNSIFSTIMTLKAGDKIFITYDGVKYTYMVQDKKEVKPEDVYILTQQYDARRLKLVTCVPEGTFLRRGVVTAQLVDN